MSRTSLCRGSLYRGLRDKVVHYIVVPLYNETSLKRTNFRCKEVLFLSSINGLTLVAA